jgi:hypothetical protein
MTYHPFEDGQFWPETHYPRVRIFAQEKLATIEIFVTPWLDTLFEQKHPSGWVYQKKCNRDWATYAFCFREGKDEENITETKALAELLNFCTIFGTEKARVSAITDPEQNQLFLFQADVPVEFYPGCCNILARTNSAITRYCQTVSRHALSEYVSSRMKGLWKILFPGLGLSRGDVDMRLYQGGNPLPIFRASGSCACLSVTSNALDYNGGFVLSGHNIDSHFNQLVLLTGTLILWQKMRRDIRNHAV